MKAEVSKKLTVQQWADKVTQAADIPGAVARIIAAGKELIKAKSDLEHGEWQNMFKDGEKPVARPIPFTIRTGQYIMSIASHPILTKTNHGSFLPPNWGTLRELAKPKYEALIESGIKNGIVRPDMERKDVRKLLPPVPIRESVSPDDPEVRNGDFRTVLQDIADNSVDLIVTDPPYAEEFLPLYGDLGSFASRVLKPGGSLICYTGQAFLPEALNSLGQHLRYWWTLCLEHRHGGQQLPGKWVLVEWKPVLWFVKEKRASKTYVADRMRGTMPNKEAHPWAQGIEEVIYVIKQLTKPGDFVVDPFAGSGAFGKAALAAQCKFLGANK